MTDIKILTKTEPLLEYWNKTGMIFCAQGSAKVRINDKNYVFSRGQIMIVAPLILIYEFEKDDDYQQIAFLGEYPLFYPIFHQIMKTSLPLQFRENPIWQISPQEEQFLKTQHYFIDEKEKQLKTLSDTDEFKLVKYQIGLLKQISVLEVVGNHLHVWKSMDHGAHKQVLVTYKFILRLHENYITHRTVQWYASQAHMSTGHFTSVIKQTTGIPPSKWIESVTTSYAKIMLETTDKSIKEIAAAFNFPEQFTFRKYFKEHTGFSPKEYRVASRKKTLL